MDLREGVWVRVMRDGKPVVKVICPGCCAHADLDDHEIAADGTVSPSLVCPFDCGFHENVRLLNWTPEVPA